MADSTTRRKSITLGRKLIAQLGGSRDSDTLSRWMAHYIAECITLAETATGPHKSRLQQRCHEAILALWEKRNSLPDGLRPFNGFEPIFRALASIDLENRPSYYLASLRRDGRAPANRREKEVAQFVELVIAVDKAARAIIEYSLMSAVETASTPDLQALLAEARALAFDSDIDVLIRLSKHSGNDTDKIESYLAAEVQRTESRLAMLNNFFTICEQIRPLFERRLEKARAHLKAAHRTSRPTSRSKKGTSKKSS